MVDSPAGCDRQDGSAVVGKTLITGIITTFNEERHVGACIESLLWCDEILVVDSFSTDRTQEIARSYTKVRFLQHPYYTDGAQKNWAMDHAAHDWVLILDADERCPDRLRDEIKQILASGPIHDAYTIRRRSYFLGKIMRFSGWQRDKVVRLVKKGGGRCPRRRVHGDVVPVDKAPYLKHAIIHHSVEDYAAYVGRVQKYAYWGAAQLWDEGRRSGVLQILGRSVWRFLRAYVFLGGFLDGMRGLVLCLIQSYGTFLKWSILWSWRVQAAKGVHPELPPFEEDDETAKEDPKAATQSTRDAEQTNPASRLVCKSAFPDLPDTDHADAN